ncbi:MAG: hypothetical protein QXK12_05545 [Candidatus Nezhaarchaeales archaeon]
MVALSFKRLATLLEDQKAPFNREPRLKPFNVYLELGLPYLYA